MAKLIDRLSWANTRLESARKSPVYRILQVLPTPARPWLLALEAVHMASRDRLTNRYERREAKLRHELDAARAERKPKKRGGGFGRLLFGIGLAVAASQLNKRKKPSIRSTGFMKSPTRETSDV
jgi:hypothetical protein